MKKYEYSDEIADVVKQFLDEDDWYYSFDESQGIFEFGLKVKSKLQRIRYLVDVRKDSLIVYGISPIGADCEDPEMMAQMAEFICRANYGLKNGNYELDYRDGEIRYKCFCDFEGLTPCTEVVDNSINYVASMFRRYASGIIDIIFSGSSAKDAIAKCEKSSEDELRSMVSELGEDASGSVEDMIARLSARLGIAEDGEDTSESEEDSQ